MLSVASPPPSFKPPSTTRTSILLKRKLSLPVPTAARLTKTTRASTKTFSPTPTPMWPKSMTRHTRAVEVMRRWRMRMAARGARMRERQSPRRRRPKQRSNGQAKKKLRRGSESCIAEALGDLDAREVLKTSQSTRRIMCYEYLIESPYTKQRQIKKYSENARDIQTPATNPTSTHPKQTHPVSITDTTIDSPNPNR